MANNDAYSALAAATGQAANMAYNWNLSKKQNQRMIDFWNMQNEYNSPRSQMQRLQEAGLNPNMIYGDSVSGATGRAENIGTPDKPADLDSLQGLTAYQSLRNMSAQEDLTRAQVLTEQEKKRFISNNADLTYYRAANENSADSTNQFVLNRLEFEKYRNSSAKFDSFSREIDYKIKDATQAEALKRIFWDAEMAEKNYDGRTLNNALLQLQKEFLSLGLDRNSPWYAKIFGALINHFK